MNGWWLRTHDYINRVEKRKVAISIEELYEKLEKLIVSLREEGEYNFNSDDMIADFRDNLSGDNEDHSIMNDYFSVSVRKVTLEYKLVPKIKKEGWQSLTKRA